jgi:hypothetical protein
VRNGIPFIEEVGTRPPPNGYVHCRAGEEMVMMTAKDPQLPTVIRPGQISPDVTYEPPL